MPPVTMRSAPTSTAGPGRSPKTSTASVTAKSGATPNATDAREAPASRIATVMKRFERPGAIAPASRNGSEAVERDAALDRRGHAQDGERRDLHEERADGSRNERRDERKADGDGHRAEERGRDEREEDGVHVRRVRARGGAARTRPPARRARSR